MKVNSLTPGAKFILAKYAKREGLVKTLEEFNLWLEKLQFIDALNILNNEKAKQ